MGGNVGSAWLGWHGWGGPVADPRDDDCTHQNTTNTTDTTAGRTEPPLRIPPRRLPAPTPLGPSTEHVPFHPSQRPGCRCPHCPDSPDRGEVRAAEGGGGLWPVGIQPGRSACALWRRNGLAVNRECLQLVRCREYPIPRGHLKHGSEAWGQGLCQGRKKRHGNKRKENNHQCSRATTRLARAVRRDHGTLLRSLLLVLVLVLRWDPITSDDTQYRARIVGSENVVHRRPRPYFVHSSTPMSMQTLTLRATGFNHISDML